MRRLAALYLLCFPQYSNFQPGSQLLSWQPGSWQLAANSFAHHRFLVPGRFVSSLPGVTLMLV